MNPHPSNADDSGGAVMTLVRLLAPGFPYESEAEVEEVYCSDWAPKSKPPSDLHRSTSVISRPPSVVLVHTGVEVLEIDEPESRWTNLPFALIAAAFFIYAVPTTLEFFASRHFSPWISTILPGDVAGCLCLATVFRMRLLGLLLYILLTASESGLYSFGLVDGGDLIWVADLIPAVFVAAMLATRSKRCYA